MSEKEAWEEFVAVVEYIRDPDSDIITTHVIEEHYGVRFD